MAHLTLQALTPRSVLLTRSLADGGTFTLTGQDVTLTYEPLGHYVLVAEGGMLLLTGHAALLVWSGFVMPPTPPERIFIVAG